jgi:hypothetical protein
MMLPLEGNIKQTYSESKKLEDELRKASENSPQSVETVMLVLKEMLKG